MRKEGEKKRYEGVKGRIRFIAIGIVAAFALLALRLWQLQIANWFFYSTQAEQNRLHSERLKAPRGLIYGPDTSVCLADNRPSCDLVIVPAECQDAPFDEICSRLGTLINIDGDALLDKIQREKEQPYRQILVKKDVSKSELARVEEFSYSLPGVFTVVTSQRRYLYGKTAGQILGYLNEILPKEQSDYYLGGDLIGRAGIEQMYESQMRGNDGQLVVNVYVSDRRPQLRTDAYGNAYIEIDSYGRKLEEEQEYRREPSPGEPVFTTLDIDLQQFSETLLEGQVGAIAILNADTGTVLTLASSPGYDPSIFVTHGRNLERDAALKSKPNPMRNRCFQEVYAPGSVFKVLLATAALEEGIINEKTTFFCPGHFQLDGVSRKWNCWKHQGHGTISIVDALAFSCDVFFYNVGLRLGVDKISEWADKLGLGVKSGIDLPQEVAGLIPSREWRETQMKKIYPDNPWEWRWYPGYTVNLAIGQGEACTTPLQNALMMAAIVNGGHHVRPYVNSAIGAKLSDPLISENTIRIVQAGLRKCVDKDPPAPTGTGNAAKVPGIAVLGKTGSAQMVAIEQYEQYNTEEDIPYQLRDHAWFIAGVLDREPRLAICILIEHGLHGSSAAAPYAADIIRHFYSRPGTDLVVAQKGNVN
ncbi:MAG: penicillin-binding protein 2 [Candidatus Hydrogenedentes bacterium]|nr:penicillin-binding protein 2 [Candidatus Hydrogenedentota bacterium]